MTIPATEERWREIHAKQRLRETGGIDSAEALRAARRAATVPDELAELRERFVTTEMEAQSFEVHLEYLLRVQDAALTECDA